MIVFGDSNVDSGYYKALSSPGGNSTFNSLWPSAVAAGAGKPTTSPGLEYSQVLAAFFGLTANPSNTAGGTNYATSGAKNVTVNNSQTGGFTAAVPTVTQISNYLSANGGVADGYALYLIHSGDNDATYAAGASGSGPYPSDPNAYMAQAASQLATAVGNLYSAGARHIIVSGLQYNFGNTTTVKSLKLLYTQDLWSDLTAAGVPFIKSDENSVRSAIAANPSQYGFTTVSNANPACTQPSGVTTAWALLCSSNSSGPSTYVSPTAPQTNLFADDEHFATAGQKIVGTYVSRLVVALTATHDFNNDGDSDLFWRDTGGNTALWLLNGGQIAQSGGFGAVPTSWAIVGQRDFDGDGNADLLWRDSSGNLSMWLMNGTAVSSTAGLGNVPTTWTVAGTGDLNGDGKGDLLWRDTAGDIAIWFMNGGTVSSTASLGNVAATWSIVGDDNKGDLFWHDNAGNYVVWQMNGAQVAQTASLGNVPLATWQIAGFGDFNGDGNVDILWRDTAGDVAIWFLNSSLTVKSTAGVGNVPTNWTIAQTGDFNGDGFSDIVWTDTSGDVAIWFMNGGTVTSTAGLGNVGTSWTVQSVNAE